jgi:hypothetical protein
MTIERARKLLELDDMTDEQVADYIAQSKQMCRSLLYTIIKEHKYTLLVKEEEGVLL